MRDSITVNPKIIDLPAEDYQVVSSGESLVLSKKSGANGRAERKKRQKANKRAKPITLFNSLSYALDQISLEKDKIFLYLEMFLNHRPKTSENLGLAIACEIYAGLNKHEREYTTYEEIILEVNKRTSGNYTIDPALFYAAVSGGAHMLNVQSARDVAVTNVVNVVKAMVNRATNPEGGSFADSKLLLEVTGVATKEGPQVVVNNTMNSQTNIEVGESGIPKFMGKVLEQDRVLREHYRKALKGKEEE